LAQSVSKTVSLIIPSRGRSLKLQNLVASIAAQQLPSGWAIETIIVIDGEGDPPDCPSSIHPRIETIEHAGAGAARNEGIRRSTGEILVFLNNDVVLQPGFVDAHIHAINAGHRAVVGHSPWKPVHDPTLFDAFVAHTPAIFAQSDLVPNALHDFRSAWTLNLSIARSVIEVVELPFDPDLRPVYYEDLEFAHRCLGGMPEIYYEPKAVAIHDHRVSIAEYVRREALLGMMSVALHESSPACFDLLFRIDPETHAEAARPMVEMDTPDHRRLLASFVEQSVQPISSIDDQTDAVSRLFVSHLPLKRRAFRLGLIAQLDRAPAWNHRLSEAASIVRADAVFGALIEHSDPHPMATHKKTPPAFREGC